MKIVNKVSDHLFPVIKEPVSKAITAIARRITSQQIDE